MMEQLREVLLVAIHSTQDATLNVEAVLAPQPPLLTREEMVAPLPTPSFLQSPSLGISPQRSLLPSQAHSISPFQRPLASAPLPDMAPPAVPLLSLPPAARRPAAGPSVAAKYMPPSPLSPGSPLLSLPAELQLEIFGWLPLRALGALAGTCRLLFHGPPRPPRPRSLVEEALRRRATEADRPPPVALPEGAAEWVPYLLRREWQHELDHGSIAAGQGAHSLFVSSDGVLLSCGLEEKAGVLGLRRSASEAELRLPRPTAVPALGGVRLCAVATHYKHALALGESGEVYHWGADAYGAVAADDDGGEGRVPTLVKGLRGHRVVRVSAGLNHSAALTEDGRLFTWGASAHGNFGLGYALPRGAGCRTAPHPVGGALAGLRVVAVAAGFDFTLAATETGAAFSFGRSGRGRLGHGGAPAEQGHQVLPRQIEGLRGHLVVGLAAGSGHALALTAAGTVFAWGDDRLGQLGVERRRGGERDVARPRLVRTLDGTRICSVAAGEHHSCAVSDAAELYTWGGGHEGQLGHGPDIVRCAAPRRVQALRGVLVVGASAGYWHTLVVAHDGRVYACGLRTATGLGVPKGAASATFASAPADDGDYMMDDEVASFWPELVADIRVRLR